MNAPPEHPAAANLAALAAEAAAASASGDPARAVRCYIRYLRQDDSNPAAHFNLGNALVALGRADKAVPAFRAVLARQTDHFGAHFNLGNVLYQLERYGDAVRSFSAALRLQPGQLQVMNNLASAYARIGLREAGLRLLEQVLAAAPGRAEALNNYANALTSLDRQEEAVACFQSLLAERPEDATLHYNLGTSLRLSNRLDEAIAAFHGALALRPDYRQVEWNLSLALLARGDFEAGWRAYEARWHKPEARKLPDHGLPLWQGERLPPGTGILLQGEQGFGDTLQFIRFVPRLQAQGLVCYLQVRPGLEGLLGRSLPGVTLLPEKAPLPAGADILRRCPLLSLPLALGLFRESDFAVAAPYLRPDPLRRDRWAAVLAARLSGPAGAPRVGLAWRGSPTHLNDARRSLAVQDLLPLLAQPGIRWVVLQKDLTAPERDWLRHWPDMFAAGHQMRDWDDTAAVVQDLDLVISVDTSVAHLAGALGRPCWLLLPHCPDWRWQLARSDSPWYPGMTLFRQPQPGDWAPALEQMAQALKDAAGDFIAFRASP